jgi:hypothetical protein
MPTNITPQDQIQGAHSTGWITISLDEYESMTHSLEILSDPHLVNQINKSRELNDGKDFEELARELGI